MSRGYGTVQRFVLDTINGAPLTDEKLPPWFTINELARLRHEIDPGRPPTKAQRESIGRAIRRLVDDGAVDAQSRVAMKADRASDQNRNRTPPLVYSLRVRRQLTDDERRHELTTAIAHQRQELTEWEQRTDHPFQRGAVRYGQRRLADLEQQLTELNGGRQ